MSKSEMVNIHSTHYFSSKVFKTTPKGMIECSECNYMHCYDCNSKGHFPLSCQQNITWNKLIDDSKPNNLDLKKCLNCSTIYEKNGGCKHHTCLYCKFEWCWDCGKPWKGHIDCIKQERERKDLNLCIYKGNSESIRICQRLKNRIQIMDQFKEEDDLKSLIETLLLLIPYSSVFNQDYIISLSCNRALEYLNENQDRHSLITLNKKLKEMFKVDILYLKETLIGLFKTISEDQVEKLDQNLNEIYQLWKNDSHLKNQESLKELNDLSLIYTQIEVNNLRNKIGKFKRGLENDYENVSFKETKRTKIE